MSETAIEKLAKRQVAKSTQKPGDVLGIISAAMQHNVDVATVERLVNLYREEQSDRRRTAFYEALARLQAKLPQIRRTGKIVDSKGGVRKYAKLEDLDKAIKPLLQEEGFAFSFDEKSVNANGTLFQISATLSHRDGHAETKVITVPFDKSQYRTDIQSRGSSQSYAQRYLIKMHLNIAEQGADDDGSGASLTTITKEQAAQLKKMLAEVNVLQPQFLNYMKAEKIESILASDWHKAINLIETKRGAR